MTFWSGEKLRQDGADYKIIENFNPEKIDCSAYTLTLGPEAFVTPDFNVGGRDNTKKTLTAPFEVDLGGGKRNIDGGELVIPPGQFALLLTEEYIRIPTHAMGFISLKFSVKGTGLINVSGFHVDPGYQGRLIFSVYNAGPSNIHMTRGQDVFLLWIADLDCTSKAPYVKNSSKNPRLSIPNSMISNADRPIHSLQQLSDKIESLQGDLKVFKGLTYSVAAILTFIFAVWRFAAPAIADAVK